jgi:hypothetical protein
VGKAGAALQGSVDAERPGCRVRVSRGRGGAWLRTRARRAKGRIKRARGRPIASGRGSHRCRRRRATHGRGGARVTALKVRLRSGSEVWVGEPSCPTLTVKFTIRGEINAIYDKHLIYIIFLFQVLI